jgi:uncharacterized membrane protein YkvA (DUF1232 family)
MQTYLLVHGFFDDLVIIGYVVADSIDDAHTYFSEKGLVFGQVISNNDYLKNMQNES